MMTVDGLREYIYTYCSLYISSARPSERFIFDSTFIMAKRNSEASRFLAQFHSWQQSQEEATRAPSPPQDAPSEADHNAHASRERRPTAISDPNFFTTTASVSSLESYRRP